MNSINPGNGQVEFGLLDGGYDGKPIILFHFILVYLFSFIHCWLGGAIKNIGDAG